MDYKILVRLQKPNPGESWAVGEVVSEQDFAAAGLTPENIKGMIAVGLVEKMKEVKHGKV
jgi:hypothetical protein